MSSLSLDEANQLAALLNQLCNMTLDALASDEVAERQEVAAALHAVQGQLGARSEVGRFAGLLAGWVEGARPAPDAASTLSAPFQRALALLLQQCPAAPEGEADAPISRRVLTQLVAAVVAARVAQEGTLSQQLATQLINVRARLGAEWRPTLGLLLENLRAALGGADPRTLPTVPEPYAALWQSAQELLLLGSLGESAAQGELLGRLAHNSRFVLEAANETLTTSYLRSLLEVQRQALAMQRPAIATLVGAIRARLQGADPAPFVTLLDGDEAAAWQRIIGSA